MSISELSRPVEKIYERKNKFDGLQTLVPGSTVVEPLHGMHDRDDVTPLPKSVSVAEIMEELKDPIGFKATDKEGTRTYFVDPVIMPSRDDIVHTPIQNIKGSGPDSSIGNFPNNVAFIVDGRDVFKTFKPETDIVVFSKKGR